MYHKFNFEFFLSIESFLEEFTSNRKKSTFHKNIIIFDDLKMFTEYNVKNFGRVMVFFKNLPHLCVQAIGVVNSSTVTPKELEFFHDHADTVANLTAQENNNAEFLCNIVKVKSSGKAYHEVKQ